MSGNILSPGGSPLSRKAQGRRHVENQPDAGVPEQQPTVAERLKSSISLCCAAVRQVLEKGAGETGTLILTMCVWPAAPLMICSIAARKNEPAVSTLQHEADPEMLR
jgi:hypothetical protein